MFAALLAACQTTPVTVTANPGTVSHLPPGDAQRDGPEANPPPNLESVPDAVPKIEPIRIGGPNKPYEIGGQTYVPLTDDRAVTEKGLASWYGKKFHGHRTASGEAYNMYAMTAAHKTLPVPSYARVRNPANGHEVIVRVNDRGPFSPGRVVDLSYTAALKLGVLGGVQQVEITRITAEDIRSGAALARLSAPADAVALAADGADPQAGAAADAASPRSEVVSPDADATGTPTATAIVATAATAAPIAPIAPARIIARDERARSDTVAGAGYWVQIGAYRQRDGALDFQHRLGDEQPWLAPMLAVITDHGLNKLQAGPYPSRDDARSAADRLRRELLLMSTIVDKR